MNIRLLKFYSLIRGLVPVYPIYLLMFESKGLSLGEISLLLAIWAAPVVLLELPTGILSDHWARKNMLVIGGLLQGVCYILWFFSESFLLFALGFILWGVSEAFDSGSLEALLFDSLKKDRNEDEFDKIYGSMDFYTLTSTALSMLMGGTLAMLLGLKAVLLLSVLTCFISSLLASRLTEVNLFKEDHLDRASQASVQLKDLLCTLGDAASFFIKNRAILILALLSILGIGVAGNIDEYDQLIAAEYGLNLAFVGLWGGVRYFLEALGSRSAYRIKKFLSKARIQDPFYSVCFLGVLGGALLGISGLVTNHYIMPLYGLFYLFSASARILLEDILQQKIEEQGRSTVHSLLSLIDNGFSVVLFSFFAIILPKLGIFGLLALTAAYLLLLCLTLGLIYKKTVPLKAGGTP